MSPIPMAERWAVIGHRLASQHNMLMPLWSSLCASLKTFCLVKGCSL